MATGCLVIDAIFTFGLDISLGGKVCDSEVGSLGVRSW